MDTVKNNKNIFIFIGVLVVVAVLVFVIKKENDDAVMDDTMTENDESETLGNPDTSVEIPIPDASSWMAQEVSESKLTLSVPESYFVSKPRIDDCDVTSISTEANGKPVSVALVYNQDCANEDLGINFAKRVEKNGYIFRTNYSSPSVLAVFDQIVASAKVQ